MYIHYNLVNLRVKDRLLLILIILIENDYLFKHYILIYFLAGKVKKERSDYESKESHHSLSISRSSQGKMRPPGIPDSGNIDL